MTQPNVVLICFDEWRVDALSCAGHPYVETPHLDELARAGVRFSSGYSATPTCVPARVAWLWRDRLIQDLTGREEGFVADGNLVAGRPVITMLSHTRERVAHATV